MQIWIDGDACPKVIKEILFKAANKRKINMFLIANHIAQIPPSPWIKRVVVSAGFDKADQYIIDHVLQYDLVITSDIILADHVISKNAIALNPKGNLYTKENIKHVLAMRNLNESLRSSGMISGSTGTLTAKEVQDFSNHLDRIITKNHP